MGQTLTHGVYLPDEGERNCYSGLASNWSILDGAVGTIAEHTTALSGKAPLVHTHVKSDITDFPAYGNAAGTICEGNDSRLSDARTPVAHTHTKSDITDLFNSANTWTANNYFPRTGFYLRGFSARASVPDSNEFSQCYFADTNNNPLMSINSANRATGARDLTFRVYTSAGNTNGVGVFKDANDNYSFCSLGPNNTIELGTLTNKWKTLNGVNPGALSLPGSSYDPISTQNWIKRPSDSDGGFMCNIVPSVNGWICIQVSREKDFGVWVVGTFRQSFRAVQTSPTTYVNMLFFPALAGSSINIYTNSVETGDADLTFNISRIYPCLGNV